MKIYNKNSPDTCAYGVNLATGEFHGFSNFAKVEEITLNVSEE